MKTTRMMTVEITVEELGQATGGTVNKNPTPNNTTGIVDQIINGGNYDAIAQAIADALNPASERTRNVNNDVDIYDCGI